MHKLADDLHQKLFNEEDARACKDIDGSACREVPGNFFRIIVSQGLTKIGDAVSNPKIVLPALLTAVGAPLALIGLLVPIREAGSLVPQLGIAGYVRQFAVRKWAWVAGSVIQGACILAMAIAALLLTGQVAGWSIVGLLVVFSLARGLCSVASKDVLGKTIPKPQRGRLNGWSSSLAGAVTIAAGVGLFSVSEQQHVWVYCALLAFGAVLWWIAAAVYSQVDEYEGATEGGANALTHALSKLRLLVDDRRLRHFVITRSLLLCSALSAPYYVLLASQHSQALAITTASFVAISGIASLLSAPFWGLFADRSSRQVMIMAAVVTALLGLVVVSISYWYPALFSSPWVLPAVYFVLTIAHEGVRLGRKTYIVNMAEGNQRTDYVSVSNTLIGFVLLFMGGVTAWLSQWGLMVVIAVLSALGLLGALMARALPEVER
ncbi:MFS transporter [Salinivibrio sp. YCSC6]|uniref:MFS transporter n=1 Tax=Salinivibrio sp. YCSC6 TaxID=2003370 RepID=UPI000BBC2858|nr:MFS transporter [Salinivibrio sp. YCSC6]PCE65220.1 MFS transporter [Salinivibrio sp. YCSC6]QCF37738.1 MFS transporter [Salinivibrio sp. YCSC6]